MKLSRHPLPWYEHDCSECGLHIPECLSARLSRVVTERDEARAEIARLRAASQQTAHNAEAVT